MVLEEIRNLTNMYDIPSYSEIDNIAILRPKVFKRLPVIVAFQVATILEGIGVYFDMHVMGEDIAVKMVRLEIYPYKGKNSEFLNSKLKRN